MIDRSDRLVQLGLQKLGDVDATWNYRGVSDAAETIASPACGALKEILSILGCASL